MRWVKVAQRLNIDFEEIYSPVVGASTLRYLINLGLIYIMDVVTTCLYDSLDNDIYMKLLRGFKLCKTYIKGYKEDYSIILNDISIIETLVDLSKVIDCLKKEFDMKMSHVLLT
ncbi:hypothetical protein CR513_20536, partial [Mucuna pruriens]